MHTLIRLSSVLLVTVGVAACTPLAGNPTTGTGAVTSSSAAPLLDEKQTAAVVLDALMAKDMVALGKVTRPGKGIRWTASTHVRLTDDDAGGPADRLIYKDQLVAAYEDDQPLVWGIEDGSGAPITLSFKQYLAKYVTDHDYRQAPDVRWNHVMDRGSSIDNAATVFPDSQIVEYHFPGFNDQYGGMDWVSLRLVLQQHPASKQWFVVAVIHDHWTP